MAVMTPDEIFTRAVAALNEAERRASLVSDPEASVRAHVSRGHGKGGAAFGDGPPVTADVPGFEGSIGPGPGQYGQPHVYARDVQSGAGNCVCGRDLGSPIHTEVAPGVPVPDRLRRDAPTVVPTMTAPIGAGRVMRLP